jgi:hypothetical protein
MTATQHRKRLGDEFGVSRWGRSEAFSIKASDHSEVSDLLIVRV